MTIVSYGYPGTIAPGAAWAAMQYGMGHPVWARNYGAGRVNAVVGGTRQVWVNPGLFGAHGIVNDVTEAELLTLPTVASGYRYYLVVADQRWNDDGNGFRTEIGYVQGTTARAIPIFIDNPGQRMQMPLALVRITAGQTAPTEIVDLRLITEGGGTYMIWDDLALGLATRAGVEVHNAATRVRRLRVHTASGAGDQWQVVSEHQVRQSRASSALSHGISGARSFDFRAERHPTGDYRNTTGALVCWQLEARLGPSAIIESTRADGGLADVRLVRIADPLFHPKHPTPISFVYNAEGGSGSFGGHAIVQPYGDITLISLSGPHQVWVGSASVMGIYMSATYMNGDANTFQNP